MGIGQCFENITAIPSLLASLLCPLCPHVLMHVMASDCNVYCSIELTEKPPILRIYYPSFSFSAMDDGFSKVLRIQNILYRPGVEKTNGFLN